MIQAYNYMLATFPVKREVAYPTNKRSELKKVYNDIVNLSRRSPYYKINLSRENQEYTFGVKETALELKSKLKSMQEDLDSGFQSKSVQVSDENVLSAKLLNEDTEGIPDIIQIKVNSLAAAQVNKGKELLYDSYAFPQGKYNFIAKVKDESYALSYIQKERTTNLEALNNVADFLNQSLPELNAVVESVDGKNYGCIRISADMSGRFGDKRFSFEDMEDYKVGLADFFGLNRIEKAPSYAKFDLNEVDKQTTTNTFTLGNTLHISLHNTGDNPVTLRIVPDSEKILYQVDSVLSTFNNIIGLAKERKQEGSEHYNASKLINEMKNLEKTYSEELTACGFVTMEDGTLELDDSLAAQAAEDGGMESLFKRENGFMSRLMDKSEAIAINPMEYIEKTIITYPNKDKNVFCNPYITSMYSGLFFNSYC